MSIARHHSGQHHLPAPNNITNRISYFTFIYSTVITCYTHVLLCFASKRHKLRQRLLVGNNVSVQIPAVFCCFPTFSLQPNKSLVFLQEAHITQKNTLCFAWLPSIVDGVAEAQYLEESYLSQNNWAQFCPEASRAFVPAGTAWSSSTKASYHVIVTTEDNVKTNNEP